MTRFRVHRLIREVSGGRYGMKSKFQTKGGIRGGALKLH